MYTFAIRVAFCIKPLQLQQPSVTSLDYCCQAFTTVQGRQAGVVRSVQAGKTCTSQLPIEGKALSLYPQQCDAVSEF